MSGLWIFGYGSLMWNPGFEYVESEPARLFGYHRALCVYSWVHRGTPRMPGLVLGLDAGGSCRGKAFRISTSKKSKVVEYLRGREQVTQVYREVLIPIVIEKSKPVRTNALCYLIDRNHEQYAGKLQLERQLELVKCGRGKSGTNPEYVLNTVAHLEELGIVDQNLQWLSKRLDKP